jgi:hypothetical protein
MLELENPGAAPAQFSLEGPRLVVTGAGGQQLTAVPVGWGANCAGPTGKYGPDTVTLGPGQRQSVCVTFRGLGGMSTGSSLALRLQAPGLELVLAAPAAPGPEWIAESRRQGSIALRTGFLGGARYLGNDSLALEFLFALNRLVVGYSIVQGQFRLETPDRLNRYFNGMGGEVRLGWLPYHFPVGVLVGADFRWVREDVPRDQPAIDTTLITAHALLRYSINLTKRRSPELLPLTRRPNPLRQFYGDAGYVRVFGRGELPSGNAFTMRIGVAHVFD